MCRSRAGLPKWEIYVHFGTFLEILKHMWHYWDILGFLGHYLAFWDIFSIINGEHRSIFTKSYRQSSTRLAQCTCYQYSIISIHRQCSEYQLWPILVVVVLKS